MNHCRTEIQLGKISEVKSSKDQRNKKHEPVTQVWVEPIDIFFHRHNKIE